MEIYCDKVRCLLSTKGGGAATKAVTVGTSSDGDGGGVSLQGAAVCKVDLGSPSSVSSVLASVARARVVASTGMNDASSRSHAVIIATVKVPLSSSKNSTDGSTTKTFAKAKLALVDLAGSERASRAQTTGSVAAEGRAINASLTALGKVVAALAEEGSGSSSSLSSSSSSNNQALPPPTTTTSSHIPYRDSSLTRVLRDCLDGSSRVAFLICASPAVADARETLGSLRFGSRARGLVAAVQASVIQSSIPAPRTPAEEEETRRELQARRKKATEAATTATVAARRKKKTIGGVTPVARRRGEEESDDDADDDDEGQGAAATSSPPPPRGLSKTQRGAAAALLSAVQLAAVLVLAQQGE